MTPLELVIVECDECKKQAEWYSTAIEKLGILRFYIHHLIQDIESYNRLATRLNEPPLSSQHLESAKKANEDANTFFSGGNK